MNKDSEIAFSQLFKEVFKIYFHSELQKPLSEAKSKLLCIEIEEKTGLVLGYKSIKNYSIYILEGSTTKKVNPSLATLDTLARYVLKAPLTTEADRKKDADHYPFWHLYKKKIITKPDVEKPAKSKFSVLFIAIGLVTIGIIVGISFLIMKDSQTVFLEDFKDTSEEFLSAKNWLLINKKNDFWKKRHQQNNTLTLYTLEGDNWPDSSKSRLEIKNLLLKPLEANCFNAEVHILDFIPSERWQQAGIILLEDTIFSGKALRLSLAYNDFFGGFNFPAEIIIQGITVQGSNNPEEILHHQIFEIENTPESLLKSNFNYCNLRIEKRGDQFRFLLANGSLKNTAFKEIGKHHFNFTPKYIGIFALKGNETKTEIIPVNFDQFKLETFSCY